MLHKYLKLNIKFGRMIIGTLLAGGFMGVSVYFINQVLNGFLGKSISTIISIIIGIFIYALAIFLFKILKKEDILMIPFGTKIYPILVKIGIYKEQPIKTKKSHQIEKRHKPKHMK